MTSEEFYDRLAQTGPDAGQGTEELAAQVTLDCRQAPDTAVRVLKQGGPLVAQARLTLANLADLALAPLISQGDPSAVQDVIWALRTEGALLAELQRKIAKYFDAHLADVRKMPPSANAGPMEETPPPVRVCDEAYLQLRRLLHVEETTDQYIQNARAFTGMADAQKDEEIRKAKQSRAFSRLTR